MTSVVVAAHNEAATIGACLDALAGAADEVIVVANGCTDDTAALARARGATVIERAEPSKPAALNAGDSAARTFPRVYLDGDVVLNPGGLAAVVAALARPGALAAVPRRDLDTTGCALLVRAYYAIHSRLPATRDGLFGRGAIAVTEAGRTRFTEFPGMIADDLFLDSLFRGDERVHVAAASSRVAAPRRTADLVRRLARVRRGNAAMRDALAPVRRARRFSWLSDVVVPRPWLAPAAVCYVALTVLAARRAKQASAPAWGRDESSREPVV